MQFATIFALAGVFISTLLAAPSPTKLAPRACTTIAPSFISYIEKQPRPDISNPGTHYVIARTNGPNANSYKTVFRFDNIPAGSTGCQLQLQWPANAILGSGNVNTDLFGVEGQVSEATTWINQPKKTVQWASVQFPTQSSPQPFKTIVQSNTCPASGSVSFLLELSDWQQGPGLVDFYQRVFYPSENTGFFLVYNC